MIKSVMDPVKYFASAVVLLTLSISASGYSDALLRPSKTFICTAYQVMYSIAGPLAILIFLIAGIKWLTSQDNPGERKISKELIKNVILGLIIILIATAVVEMIVSLLGLSFSFTAYCA